MTLRVASVFDKRLDARSNAEKRALVAVAFGERAARASARALDIAIREKLQQRIVAEASSVDAAIAAMGDLAWQGVLAEIARRESIPTEEAPAFLRERCVQEE